MSAHDHPRPIGGRILDRPVQILLSLFVLATVVIAYRLFAGVGPVSNMTDGFAWGIWEPINVVVFTGIGAGALGIGLVTYVLNRGEYHGLVRPAVLLGAVCYTLGGTSIMIALGRYWNALLLPAFPLWNLGSALLEVAVCVLVYLCVLWLEVLPAMMERLAQVRSERWSAVGRKVGRWMSRAMPYLIALAIVLPVMHQSSLGGLMLIPESKVHPLWHTALLPLLFLVSCISMGYGAVVVLVTLLHLRWNAPEDPVLLARLGKVNAWLIAAYLVVRLGDLALRGRLGLLGLDGFTLLFAIEIALFAAAMIQLLRPAVQRNRGRLFGAALLSIWAGALYRVDAYLSVFRPAPGWDYWPSLGEIVITVGMGALGVAGFIVLSRIFPVVVVEPRREEAPRTAAAGR